MSAYSYYRTLANKNPYGTLGVSPQVAARINKTGRTPLGAVPDRAPVPAPYDPYADATQSVNSLVDAMIQQVREQQAQARAQAERDAQEARAKGQALAEGLKALGLTGAIQSVFQNAANAQAGLAQGFSGQTRADAAAQAAEQQRQLAGSGQEGAVRNQGEAMGSVQYGVGGYIPASTFNTQAANYAAQAALEPGFALQYANIAAQNRMNDFANQDLPEYEQQIQDIIAKRPSYYQDYLQSALQRDNTLYQRRADQRDFAAKQKAATAQARQNQIDRQVEAVALKISTGIPLTARDKRLLDTYGLSSQTANALIRGNQDKAAAKARAALAAANNRAAMAKAKYQAAAQAAREAKAQAARSKLESDKAAYRAKLEAQKAAYRAMLEAQKALTKARRQTNGNAGDSAEASGGKPAGLG